MNRDPLWKGLTRGKAAPCTVVRSTTPPGSQMAKVSRSTQTGRSMRGTSQRDSVMVWDVASHPREKCSKEHSLTIRWTAMGTSSGLMARCSRVNGVPERRMARVSSSGRMGSSTRVSSKITSATGTECCTTLVERGLRDSGRMERRTVDVSTLGLTVPATTLSILTGRSKVKESSRTALSHLTILSRPTNHCQRRVLQPKTS